MIENRYDKITILNLEFYGVIPIIKKKKRVTS